MIVVKRTQPDQIGAMPGELHAASLRQPFERNLLLQPFNRLFRYARHKGSFCV